MWNLAGSPIRTLRGITEWPVASQQIARHNAFVASTALAERRSQSAEAEEFLAVHLEKRAGEARLS